MPKLVLVSAILIAAILFYLNRGYFFPEMFLTPQELREFGNDIQKTRAGIDIYKLLHKDQYPDLQTLGWKPLIEPSTIDGSFDAADGQLQEPFLHSARVNPLTHSSTIYFIDFDPLSDFRASTEYGFVYNTHSHQFWGIDARGQIFDDHKYRHP